MKKVGGSRIRLFRFGHAIADIVSRGGEPLDDEFENLLVLDKSGRDFLHRRPFQVARLGARRFAKLSDPLRHLVDRFFCRVINQIEMLVDRLEMRPANVPVELLRDEAERL
jgi:hypothetical protein